MAGAESVPMEIDGQSYGELRKIARSILRGRGRGRPSADCGANTTALVNDAWIKLSTTGAWENKAHFFGSSARAMRQVLVEEARYLLAQRRDVRQQVSLSDVGEQAVTDASRALAEDVLAVEEAIRLLEEQSELAGTVASLRLHGGLTVREIAAYLGLSESRTRMVWRVAKEEVERRLGAG